MADNAHLETDKRLAAMEKRLTAIYIDSVGDMTANWHKYLIESGEKIKELQSKYDEAKASGDQKAIRKAGKKLQKAKRERTLRDDHYKRLTERFAEDVANVNKTALAYINGEIPEIYALNYNAAESGVKAFKGYSFELVNPDTVRELATADKIMLPYKELDEAVDVALNVRAVNNQVLKGILAGSPMDAIAESLVKVVGMNRNAAITNARTMVTGAENLGRVDSHKRLESDGVILEEEWVATKDARTRHSHVMMNGEKKKVGELFSNGLEFPGDSRGRPEEVYNCRCTLVASVKGFKRVSE